MATSTSQIQSCTICSSDLSQDKKRINLELKLDKCPSDALSSDLEVFFVLRNVLQIPSSLIQELMVSQEGRRPSEWGLGFCGLCLRMVQEAGYLFSRIRQLIKDYDQVAEGIRGRGRVNANVNAVGDKARMKGRGRTMSKRGGDVAENSVLFRIQQHLADDSSNSENNSQGQSSSGGDRTGISSNRRTSPFNIQSRKPAKNQGLPSSPINDVPVIDCATKYRLDNHPATETLPPIPDPAEDAVVQTKLEPDSDPEQVGCFDHEFHYEGNDEGEEFVPDQDSKLVEDESCDLQIPSVRRSLRPRKKSRRKNTDSEQEEDENKIREDPDDEFVPGYDSENGEKDADSDFEARLLSRKRKSDSCQKDGGPEKKSTGPSLSTPTRPRPHLSRKEAPTHQCPYCTTAVKGKFSLDAHILRVHQGVTQPFPCDLCNQSFSKLSTVMLHIDLRHSSEIKNCTNPPPERNDLEVDPTETKLFNAIFTSEDVGTGNEDNSELSEPIEVYASMVSTALSKTPEQKSRVFNAHLPFKCGQCDYYFSAQWLVNAHTLRCHHGDSRSFECDNCPRRFARKAMLFEHRTVCHPKITTPYDGPQTALETRITELEKKKKRPQIIPDITPSKVKHIYTCMACDVKFTSRITCEVHIKRVHQGADKKLPCPFPSCEAYFLSVTGQKAHYDQTHVNSQLALVALKNQPLRSSKESDQQIRKSQRPKTTSKNNDSDDEDNEEMEHDDNQNDDSEDDKDCNPGDENSFLEYTTGTGPSLSASSSTRPHLTPKEAPQHQCPHCPSALRGKFNLDAHILRVHQGVGRPFPCDICSQSFSKLSNVMLHIDLRHSSEIKNCVNPPPEKTDSGVDPTETKLFNALFTTVEVDVEENSEPIIEATTKKSSKNQNRKSRSMNAHLPFKCDECGFHFSAQWLVNAHILRCHHGDIRSFECDKCPKRFARKVVLFEHRTTLHHKITTPYAGPKTPLETRIAELKNKSKRPLIIPDIPPLNKQIFTCTICKVKFTSRITCEVHLKRVHQGPDKKLPCPFPSCGAYFLSITGQKAHYDQIHLNLQQLNQPLRCKESGCGADFKRQSDLNQHLRLTHSIIQQHMCELCPNVYNDLHSLKNHQLQAHHEELGFEASPFKCEFCGKILNSKRSLETHRTHVHTKQWKFLCPHCPRGFAQEVQRKDHVKLVHLKVRPFTCPHPGCGRRFAQGFNLKSHLRVHSGEKPWNCQHCGKAFSDKSTYNRHMESHGQQIHICLECGKQFKIWHAYRLHCKSHEKGVTRRTAPKRRRKQRDEDESSNSGNEEEQESDSNSNDMPILKRDTFFSNEEEEQYLLEQPPLLVGYSHQQS